VSCRWLLALCVLASCREAVKAPSRPASRPALPLTDVLARWGRELPATFPGDPLAPPGPPPSAATVALRDAFLADPNGREGIRARNSLIGTDDGVGACEQMLQAAGTPPETRALLLETLAGAPDTVCVAPLVRLLTDPDPILRRRAAWHLGRKDAALALPNLILRLRPLYEADPEAFVWVADAVARLGNPSGVAGLIEMLPVAAVRDLAGRLLIEALRRADVACEDNEHWDPLRKKGEGLVRQMRAQPPAALTPELRLVLARQVRKLPLSNLRDVDEGRFVLAHMGAVATPMLAECALDLDRYVRIHTVEVLGELGPQGRAALPAVLLLLDDPLAEIYAVEVLGRLGDPTSFDAIAARLSAGKLDLRIGALKGLAALADPRCVPLVTPLLDQASENLEVRIHAAHALARTNKDPRATLFLEDALTRHSYNESTLRAMLAGLR
jgi:HEAT repeat protein